MNKRARRLISVLVLVVLMSVSATAIVAAASPLMIDSFSSSSKWSSKLNDLNKSVSWSMDSVYYGDSIPGNIVLNSGGSGQYYQETITQSISGGVNLTLRMRDWWDSDTENHWNIVLNDGTDHAVALNAYGNVNTSYQNFNIPLSAFNANLANVQHVRIVHKDSTYAVLLIDAISIDGGVGPTSTPGSTATNTPVPPTATRTNTPVPPTATRTNTLVGPTATRTNTPVPPTATRTNTPVGPTATRTNTPVGPTATRTNTPVAPTATRTNTPVPPTATRTNTPVGPTTTAVSASYEAESGSNTLAGGAVAASCGACSGGNKVGYVGNNSGTLQFNGVNATSGGTYNLVIYYLSGEARSAQISVNGGATTTLNFASTGSWDTVGSTQVNVSLNTGGNTIKFSNSSGWAPDFDRITTNSGPGPTPLPTLTPTIGPSPTNTPLGPTNTPTPTGLPTMNPAGRPTNPYSAATPDAALAVHALTRGADPITNPLKGLAIWYYSGDHADKTVTGYGGIMNSVEWKYFGFGELMTGANSYDWSKVEYALDEVASHGKQLSLRVASCESFSSADTPAFLTGELRSGCILWYDHPAVMSAFTNFIAAFGARYDGDPRIAFIHLGLVGRWGEWHTWPNDTPPNDYMISNANANILLDAYNAAFTKTRLEVRYPRAGGGTHLATISRIGFHDDSFLFRENDPLLGRTGSMTLPLSMNGKTDALLTQELQFTTENKWMTASIGGEVRPEIQSNMFDAASTSKDDAMMDIEMAHATWMICQNCKYNINNAAEVAGWRKMGYNLYVSNAYYNNTVATSFKVGVKMENSGVAPFYYGPETWPVELALKDGSGAIVKTWTTTWDLRKVLPLTIRAFPDWNIGTDPTYVSLGVPQYFETTVDSTGVARGGYTLVMHVYNPLWQIHEADVRAAGHMPSALPWYNPLPLLFANQSQAADGWLNLGSITLN